MKACFRLERRDKLRDEVVFRYTAWVDGYATLLAAWRLDGPVDALEAAAVALGGSPTEGRLFSTSDSVPVVVEAVQGNGQEVAVAFRLEQAPEVGLCLFDCGEPRFVGEASEAKPGDHAVLTFASVPYTVEGTGQQRSYRRPALLLRPQTGSPS